MLRLLFDGVNDGTLAPSARPRQCGEIVKLIDNEGTCMQQKPKGLLLQLITQGSKMESDKRALLVGSYETSG